MGYNLQYVSEKKLVRVIIKSHLAPDVRLDILRAVHNQLVQNNCFRVLMDVTESIIHPDEPVTNSHALVKFMLSIGFKPETKMAFVYSDAEPHRRYFEIASNMKGLNIKYFRNHDKAYEWLGVE